MQEKLIILRKKQGLNMKDMGDILNISRYTYSLKERGVYEFTQDEMFLLSEKFDKTIAEIFLPRSHQNGDKVTEKEGG